MAHCYVRAKIEKTPQRNNTDLLMNGSCTQASFAAHRNAHLAGMRSDDHHGVARGFPANWAKRRCIAFSDLHAQGCAPSVFVMMGSIGKIAAAQQKNLFYTAHRNYF
jgi:hypothetical protein